MKLDLSEIARTPNMHVAQDIDEPCPRDTEMECTQPVRGQLQFTNTGSLLLVEGKIKTEVKLECGRCLVDFTMPVEATVEEEFRLENVGDAIRILPLDEEDEISAEMVSNNVLDVQELIRQNLLLELPIQPLCKPECMGLCPTCGKNLNVRKCTCPPAEPESPFQALADLLKEEDT